MFSEAKLRHVSLNGFAQLAHYLRFGVLWNPNSRVVERECSKPAENQQSLKTNHIQETLVLAQNNEKIKIFSKSSLLTLTNDLFCYLTSSLHHPASLYREGSICEEDILRYSLERRCNQKVTGWLTFDILPQREIRTFLLPFMFQLWSKKLKYSTLP